MFFIYHQGRLCRIYDISYEYSPSIFDSANPEWRSQSQRFRRMRHYRGKATLSALIKNHIFIGTVHEYRYLPTWISSSFDVIRFDLGNSSNFYDEVVDEVINDGLVSYHGYCNDVSRFLDKIICHVILF